MSEKNTTETKAAGTASAKSGDIFEAIGPTLTFAKAKELFGENALTAMQSVASIGGHGMFEPHEFASPLFGGLQMPDPERVMKPERHEFKPGDIGDHHFGLAQEDYKLHRQAAVESIAKTKEALTALK